MNLFKKIIWCVERETLLLELENFGFVFVLLNNKCLLPDDYLVGLFHSVYGFLFVTWIQEHSQMNDYVISGYGWAHMILCFASSYLDSPGDIDCLSNPYFTSEPMIWIWQISNDSLSNLYQDSILFSLLPYPKTKLNFFHQTVYPDVSPNKPMTSKYFGKTDRRFSSRPLNKNCLIITSKYFSKTARILVASLLV